MIKKTRVTVAMAVLRVMFRVRVRSGVIEVSSLWLAVGEER